MMPRLIPLAAAACVLLAANNAHAHGQGPISHSGHGYPQSMPYPQSYPYPGASAPHGPALSLEDTDRARAEWVDDCANRYLRDRNKGDAGIAGAAVGAIVGGVAGNRIAGRGDRLGGTLLGAGVGGLAGLAIGSAIDRSKLTKDQNEAYDWCLNYLDNYYAQDRNYGAGGYAHAYPHPQPYPHGQVAYAIPYGPPMMMMPVMIPVQRCHEREVIEEVVERPVVYHKRARRAPTKYVKQRSKYVK